MFLRISRPWHMLSPLLLIVAVQEKIFGGGPWEETPGMGPVGGGDPCERAHGRGPVGEVKESGTLGHLGSCQYLGCTQMITDSWLWPVLLYLPSASSSVMDNL